MSPPTRDTDMPDLPANPNYGAGMFVRSLRITTPAPGEVLLGMEDVGHALQIRFTHDGDRVRSVSAQWHRHPLSLCGGAADALRDMVGCPLAASVLSPQQHADPRQHCTHLFDMLRLGITHAWHRREDRRYDIIIRDALHGPLNAELWLADQLLLAIGINNGTIIAPAAWAGVDMLRGFTRWATAHLTPAEFEWAFMLQRGYFVARGRRLDLSVRYGKPAREFGPPVGSCFASQPQRYDQAMQLPHRDIAGPEETLRFFPLPEPEPLSESGPKP